MKILLYLSKPAKSTSVSFLSVSFHVSTTARYLSSSVIRPLLKFWEILSTVVCASSSISCFCAGTVISEMDTVIAALVEYLYPVDLIKSNTSAVTEAPCVLMTFSRICFNCFFPTWKSTSGKRRFSGLLLST